MECFSPFALRKASWQSKLITLTSEESGSASNSLTLDLFSLSLFHRYDRSHFVARGGGGGVLGKSLMGVCRWDSETLNLYQTTFMSFLQTYSRLDAKSPYPIPD